MRQNFFHKLKFLLNSRKIFKNWYIFPLIYFNFSKTEYSIFETFDNIKLKIRNHSTDLMALTNVWIIREYENEKISIKDNDTIIDIGAHIGLFSLFVSQFCKNGKIFSFEPISENYDLLKSNISLNNSKNIFPTNCAVSKTLSKIKIFLNDDQSGHSIMSDTDSSVIVDSILLKDIFDLNKITTCNLLKLDCEGAEYEIINSLPQEYFEKIEKIVIEYHFADSKPELSSNLFQKLCDMGFKISSKPHYNDMGFLIAIK
jgi:FkbM family methyltransferase